MANDGPPWVVGSNCNLTLRHPSVNGDEATGFYVKPDSFRVLLPKVFYSGANSKGAAGVATPLAAGKRVVEFVVVCRDGAVHQGNVPSQLTAAQWHAWIVAFAAQVNSPIALVDPSGAAWTVVVDEMEDRLSPLGGQWLLEWETRCVFVEQ
jgi:hypothetical protein